MVRRTSRLQGAVVATALAVGAASGVAVGSAGGSAAAAAGALPQAAPQAAAQQSGYRLDDLPAVPAVVCGAGCVDVRRAGAAGDGEADDTAVLQRVLDGAVAAGTPLVHVPAGTYRLTSTLKVPGGVTLAGDGIVPGSDTVLRLDWEHRQSFTKVLVPAAGATKVVVRDLTIDGGRRVCENGRNVPDVCPADRFGGITAGDDWTITRVRFTAINGFKVWVAGVSGVEVSWCRFDGLVDGGTSGGMDNIGGGAAASRVVLAHNAFDTTAAGNSIDLTRASKVTVSANRVWGTPQDPHNMYLEGVTSSVVSDNVLHGAGGITLQSNGNYASSTKHGVINPEGNTVTRNTVVDSTFVGVQVIYRGFVGAGREAWDRLVDRPKDLPMTAGGRNTISGNVVVRPAKAGIAVIGTDDRWKRAADLITDNTVLDPGRDGEALFNDGHGITEVGGIVLAIGKGDVLRGNVVLDGQPQPTTRYGVVVGRLATTTGVRTWPTATVVTDTRTAGLTGPAVRFSQPTVATVSAKRLSTAAGQVVTVTGRGFLRPADEQIEVRLGATVVPSTVVDDTTLRLTTRALPAGDHPLLVKAAGGWRSDLVVTGLDGTTGRTSPPVVVAVREAVDPVVSGSVPASTRPQVVRVGTSRPVGATAADHGRLPVTATLDGRSVPVRYVSSTSLDITVPARPAGSGTLRLTRDGVSGSGAVVTFTAAG